MQPVASTEGGVALGAPDVCLTPPPPPKPIPYPNSGMLELTQATAPTVFIQNMPVVVITSVIPVSVGDEPGVLLGVASHHVAGTVRFTVGSSKVYAAGQPVVYLTSATTHNGDPPNVPGAVIDVIQTTVYTAP